MGVRPPPSCGYWTRRFAIAAAATMLGGAVLAAYYVGACIGSLTVATGQVLVTSTFKATAHPFRLDDTSWFNPIVQEVLECAAARRAP